MQECVINLEDIELDDENPRHDRVKGTREAIQALLEQGGEKLVALAESFVRHGMMEAEVLVAMPAPHAPGIYVVLEGNRRIAVLKLLKNPSLANGHILEGRFRDLSAKAPEFPSALRCTVVSGRDEARPLLKLRHNGEQMGAGIVPWGAAEKQRFEAQPGTQAYLALAFCDKVDEVFRNNKQIRANLAKIRRERLTTLGRLVGDPDFRKAIGIQTRKGEFRSHYSAKDIEPVLSRLLEDLAGGLTTVTDLKTKDMRKEYHSRNLADLLPSEAEYHEPAIPLTFVKAGTPSVASKKPSNSRQRKSVPRKNLFDGLELRNFSSKISGLFCEIKKLDLDDFPNSAPVLIRVLLDLVLAEAHDTLNWKLNNDYLKERLKKALRELDPKEEEDRFAHLRKGLNDGTSLWAPKTLQAFVHNRHYHPTATEARQFSENLVPFLEALDDKLGCRLS